MEDKNTTEILPNDPTIDGDVVVPEVEEAVLAVVGDEVRAVPEAQAPATSARGPRNPRRQRRTGRREERARPEFEQKIISIRRVTRVMAGGRRFNFSVAMVAGDKKGKVGVGIGKAGDTQLAIEKALRDARRHMITVPINKEQMVPHDATVKYSASQIMIMPAPGRGIVAGSSVRTVLELAGVKDVTAKVLSRSKNKLNNARAAIKALSSMRARS
ncbi:30S ribosomal protein S5 [Candidatus Kaiserbacteria bacterium]|nr:30S ribosomal protein S5 [Candidatus Kaiserbacteria bacterium]